MPTDYDIWLGLAVALGLGLLIGTERERNKRLSPIAPTAGIRTFTLVSMLGAISAMMSIWLLVAALVGITIFSALAYNRNKNTHPGLTSEVTLLITLILGALTNTHPALAAGLGVAVAVLLAARVPLHGFVHSVLTTRELNDFLLLAAASLVVLPMLPNQALGPFAAINPHQLWLIVILIMAIGAVGHISLRMLGSQLGLPIVGLASGFVSSTVTIGAMGLRAKQNPGLKRPAVAGAVLSTIATIVQMALILAATSQAVLINLTLPLLCGGLAATLYSLLFTFKSLRDSNATSTSDDGAFSIKAALILTATIACVLVVAAALKQWFGQVGLIMATAITGFADTHAAAISVAALENTGKISASAAEIPILIALSTNTISKIVVAAISGGRNFARHVIPGLILVILAIWLGWWLS